MVTRRALPFAAALGFAACTAGGLAPGIPKKKLVVPPAMAKPPADDASAQRAVVRMTENGRQWELWLPEGRGAYEMRVPLASGVPSFNHGDEALFSDAQAYLPADGNGGADGGTSRQLRRSYLAQVAQVNELYSARRFELALMELATLEKEYPKDARLHAMKGSLLLKLGEKKRAKEAWEKALALNPNNLSLAEALRELSEGEE